MVVEKDARRILLSSPPRAGCRMGIIGSERRHEAGRSGCSFPLLSLPVRDESRRRRSPETTERRHEAGRSGCSFPLLSLPVRDASRRRRSPETTERWHEAGRSGCSFPLLSLPVTQSAHHHCLNVYIQLQILAALLKLPAVLHISCTHSAAELLNFSI